MKTNLRLVGIKDVEVNESYFGPKSEEGKRGRGSERKTPVIGIVERGGRIYTQVIPDARKDTLQPIVENTVKVGQLFTLMNGLDTMN